MPTTTTDFLADLRRVGPITKAGSMNQDQKAAYLRDRGWKQLRSRGTQRWQSRSGLSATLLSAAAYQLQADLDANAGIDIPERPGRRCRSSCQATNTRDTMTTTIDSVIYRRVPTNTRPHHPRQQRTEATLQRRRHAALHERVALHQTHTRSDSRGARPRQRKNNNMTTKYCSDEQLERVINTPSTPCAASCGVPLATLNLINGDTWRPAQFASSLSRFPCGQAACWPRGRRV